MAAGKAVAAAEGGEVSDFLLVVEDRLSDLRRGLYAGDVVWTDGGGGRWPRWERTAYGSHNYLATSNRAGPVVERMSGKQSSSPSIQEERTANACLFRFSGIFGLGGVGLGRTPFAWRLYLLRSCVIVSEASSWSASCALYNE